MKPTPFAESIAMPIRNSLDVLRRNVVRRTRFDPATDERTLHLTTSDVGVMVFIPPLLEALRTLAPRLDIQVVAVAHDYLENALDQNAVDIAVGYFPDLNGPNIITQKLFDHPFTCIVSDRHPTIVDQLSLDQFLAADHIVINEPGRSQELFERKLHELGLARRVVLHLPHFMSVPQIVSRSNLIATVPRSLGVWYQHDGIRMFAPPIDAPVIQLAQYWHRRLNDDDLVTWLHRLIARLLTRKDPSQAFTQGYSAAR